MGWVRTHTDTNGAKTYNACYRDRWGRIQTAGTFRVKREAIAAWRAAETKHAEGRTGDPRRGRQRFAAYVIETWLPNHVMEVSTQQGYTYQIRKHLIPYFGPMRMIDITPAVVREWVTACTTAGMTPKTLKNVRNILSAIFTTALNDQVVFFHPCKGVKTPRVVAKTLQIITPEQFDVIYDALPDSDLQLMIETAIETGLRWGELTELRPHDLNRITRVFTISRAVVEVDAKFHPTGDNFLVKDYPKDGEHRKIKISRQLVDKITNHLTQHDIDTDSLLFQWRQRPPAPRRVITPPNPDLLGLTEPNDRDLRYKHGTTTAYNAGRCRCQHCRDAIAIYRAARRAAQGRTPRPRQRHIDADGHIPREWFRNQIWKPALAVAAIGIHVRPHDLRHAHASWLLAGGADLQKVKERLGHASITTTEKYLHTLPDADESALDAFSAIRNRSRR